MPRALPPLLPAPKRITPRAGGFTLRDGRPIVLGPEADDADFASARFLRDAVRDACGVELAVETHARASGLGPGIGLRRDGRVGDAYRISVSRERIELIGAGGPGLRHAAATLAQLVAPGGRVPACRIEDSPDFALRGILVDVSRGKVPTPETLRELVDRCALLKLNALMLYTEHTFRFRRHPRIGAGASSLDAETVRELDAYAAARHVELIPSLQSLGHMEHILAIPDYAHLAETEARWTLSPVEPGSYELLRDLYDEYLPNFRSRLFNANCDEPFDLGRGKSAQRARELGPGGLYLEHVGRVRELARAHGKRTMIWADVIHAHPGRIGEIHRDLVLLDWWYEADHAYDRVKAFAEHGIDFVVCPGTSSWNTLFPRMENSLTNIAGWAQAGRRHGALGLMVTDWGDFGHYNLQGNSWLAFAWAAQQAWSGDAPTRDFDRAFSRLFFGEASGEAARLYRQLGAVHDAGFAIPNASALQLLYFDDLDHAYFLEAAREPALRRSLARLARVDSRLARARGSFGPDGLTFEELRYACDASILAVRKALAALEYLGWRRVPERLDARGRRRLSSTLSRLAHEQAVLAQTLRQLWLRRSRISNFDLTRRRLEASIRSLRRASRAVARSRPPAPPPRHGGFGLADVLRAIRRSVG